MIARRFAFALALLVPAALMAGALWFQFAKGLPPCEMCWWQRYPHIVAIVLAAFAWTRFRRWTGTLLVTLAALCILASGLIGAFHAGVEYGWWQGLTRCASIGFSGGDPLASVMNSPLIRCDVAAWRLFGISMAGYNFLISTGSAILIFYCLIRGRGQYGRRRA